MLIVLWFLTNEGRGYDSVCKWLVQHYAKALEPDELILIAMDAGLDKDVLIKSLFRIDEMYY